MRFMIVLIAAVVAALAVTELTMQPTAADRAALLVIFGAIAGATGLAGWLLPRVTHRFRTLRHTVLLVSMAAVAVVAVAVAVSAQLMFLSSHDLRLVVVAVGLGVVLGALLAATISPPGRRSGTLGRHRPPGGRRRPVGTRRAGSSRRGGDRGGSNGRHDRCSSGC